MAETPSKSPISLMDTKPNRFFKPRLRDIDWATYPSKETTEQVEQTNTDNHESPETARLKDRYK